MPIDLLDGVPPGGDERLRDLLYRDKMIVVARCLLSQAMSVDRDLAVKIDWREPHSGDQNVIDRFDIDKDRIVVGVNGTTVTLTLTVANASVANPFLPVTLESPTGEVWSKHATREEAAIAFEGRFGLAFGQAYYRKVDNVTYCHKKSLAIIREPEKED